jgi:hypothetical protein
VTPSGHSLFVVTYDLVPGSLYIYIFFPLCLDVIKPIDGVWVCLVTY